MNEWESVKTKTSQGLRVGVTGRGCVHSSTSGGGLCPGLVSRLAPALAPDLKVPPKVRERLGAGVTLDLPQAGSQGMDGARTPAPRS